MRDDVLGKQEEASSTSIGTEAVELEDGEGMNEGARGLREVEGIEAAVEGAVVEDDEEEGTGKDGEEDAGRARWMSRRFAAVRGRIVRVETVRRRIVGKRMVVVLVGGGSVG